MSPSERSSIREARLRLRAAKQGLLLRKSRAQHPHVDDLGGYQLLDPQRHIVVDGSRFELSLDDIEELLRQCARR